MTTKKLSYTNNDFDSLVLQLENRLRAKGAWKDTYKSATGATIIDLFAFIADQILYYVERRAEECYIGTAQNRSSVINLVRLLNYIPKRSVSATGKVVFSIDSSVDGIVYIPQYTEIQTSSGVKFVTVAQGTIPIGSTQSNEITVVQGTKEDYSVYSDGSADQEINIEETTIENDSRSEFSTFSVFVAGRLWTKVDSFLSSDGDSEHYMLRHELDDTITVIFGDNLRGKIPEDGDQISVQYILSDGTSGNVYEVDKITEVVSSSVSYDYVDDEDIARTGTVTLSVTNTTTVVGGDDAETTEEIRTEAPNVFQTGDRLVTKADFVAFLFNYPSIAEVNIWGENEESPPNYDMFNKVKIVLMLESWQLPTAQLKSDLEDALYEKSMMTVKYEFIDAVVFNVVPVLRVVVNSKYGLSTTQAEIESALNDQFLLGTTAKFGEAKRLSNLIEIVDSLESVKHHYMTLEVREVLVALGDSNGSYSAALSSDTVKEGSCKLYIGTLQVAVDVPRNDSSLLGDFVLSDSNYTIVGTIDYSTKEILVEITPTPESAVYVRYEQDEDGDVVVGNSGICKLFSVDINTIEYESE